MELVESISETIRERLLAEPLIWIPASLEEFWETIEAFEGQPYDIEYINGEIRAKMSQASKNHELIVTNTIRVFGNLYLENDDYLVYGSARVVYIPECNDAYNPDITIVKGEDKLIKRQGRGKSAGLLNPFILIEVQSDATENIDFGTKLKCYKKAPSVQYIVHISQYDQYVGIYSRQGTQWIYEDYDSIESLINIDGLAISMKEIYRKVIFELKNKRPY